MQCNVMLCNVMQSYGMVRYGAVPCWTVRQSTPLHHVYLSLFTTYLSICRHYSLSFHVVQKCHTFLKQNDLVEGHNPNQNPWNWMDKKETTWKKNTSKSAVPKGLRIHSWRRKVGAAGRRRIRPPVEPSSNILRSFRLFMSTQDLEPPCFAGPKVGGSSSVMAKGFPLVTRHGCGENPLPSSSTWMVALDVGPKNATPVWCAVLMFLFCWVIWQDIIASHDVSYPLN